jgi:hypothetical protein
VRCRFVLLGTFGVVGDDGVRGENERLVDRDGGVGRRGEPVHAGSGGAQGGHLRQQLQTLAPKMKTSCT